jgi:Icc-related predicted phosphoesterase
LDYIKLHIQSVKDAEDKRKAEHEAAIKAKAEADARAKLEADAKAKADADAKALAEQVPIVANAAHNDWPVVDASFNENDFNNVFEVSTASNIQLQTESTGTAFVKPSRKDLIACVANRYSVTHEVAQNWLIEAFEQQAKAA